MPWRPPRSQLELVIRCETTSLAAMSEFVGPAGVDGSAVEEPDGLWLRTFGLVGFGRPDLEVDGTRPLERAAAEAARRGIAGHLADGGTIEALVDVDAEGHAQDTGRGLGGSLCGRRR